ncbi:ATP-dependent RNA helicase A [Taenia crassiceps]|uniref:RNA helicase n=1 Tax=Taenia crassiceps TaxID=6207 RepID=A0ABR4QGQ9_9CEST
MSKRSVCFISLDISAFVLSVLSRARFSQYRCSSDMSDVEGIKAFVYTWLHKTQRKVPEYTFQQRSVGRGRSRFICELRVDGFSYIGVGNSINKKDAQTNAARDFANFLVREGYLKAVELPIIRAEEYKHMTDDDGHCTTLYPSTSSSGTVQPSYRSPHSQAVETNAPVGGSNDSYINRIMDRIKLEEAEEVDLTADIHGGWSMENSKARLNEYLQASRQPPVQIKFTSIGPDHNKSFLAEATVWAKRVNKTLYARENGSNKTMSSRACCLSLVRQLFHVGEIEAYSGERKKKRSDELPPLAVKLDPDLENRLNALLEKLHLVPNLSPPAPSLKTSRSAVDSSEEEHNMIMHYQVADFEPRPRQSAQLVSWCPPIENWNPWTACNIDEGPEALMSLAQISQTYKEQYDRRINSRVYNIIREERNSLPVAAFSQHILETIARNQVTLIKGETGCGKTTQVPQFILDSHLASGKGAECAVLVTQPRRICAISLAERVASERCEAVGVSVGYSVRFETILPRPYGSILFCTIGTLCRKMEAGIRGVSHIIVDEIHERDVNTDFVMILMRDLVRANPSLRVILMSATIDTTTFTEYFDSTATVELEGRTYPVSCFYLEDCINLTNYVPPPNYEKKNKKPRLEEGLAMETEENCNLICPPGYPPSVAEHMRQIPEKEVPFTLIGSLLEYICRMGIDGAVLVFLPGWNTISILRKYLQTHPRFSNPNEYLILPLHSQVPREDQRLVFRPAPPGVRKIVLSTNIAESSITINDVVFVIDTCLARVKMFTARNNLTSYSTMWASRTNLEQRRGRAGRVRAGFAYHLCSRARLNRLEHYATPEILRTPLHELALMIKLLRLGDIQTFLRKALQSPPLDAVIEAEYTLRDMKALDSNDELTPLGHILARLPIEPRLGRMLVFSCAFRLGGAMALIAAHSSFGCDVLAMPPDRRRLSWGQIRFAVATNSDHLAMLNAFQVWSTKRNQDGDQAANYLCDARELNAFSLRIIDEAANQICNILMGLGFPESVLSDRLINFNDRNCPTFDYVAAMLTNGLYPNIACHVEKRKLLTAEGKCALVHKGSVNCTKNPSFAFPLFAFTEKIRTQAISCKTLTMITPIQLLLFGCRRGIWKPKSTDKQGVASMEDEGVVLLDDWLPFRMRYSTAARIFALRPALEALLVRVCLRPECLENLSPEDNCVIELTKELCRHTALRGVAGPEETAHLTSVRFSAGSNRPLLTESRQQSIPFEMRASSFDRNEGQSVGTAYHDWQDDEGYTPVNPGHTFPYYPRAGVHGTKRDYPWPNQETYIPQNYGDQIGSLQQSAGYWTESSPRYETPDYSYELPLPRPPGSQPWRQPRPPHPY